MTDWRKWLANGLLLAWIGLAVGCTAVADKPELQSAKTFPVITQVTFDDYRLQTRQWLTEHRLFLSEDPAAEVEANSPQEWRPTSKPKKAFCWCTAWGIRRIRFPTSARYWRKTVFSADIVIAGAWYAAGRYVECAD